MYTSVANTETLLKIVGEILFNEFFSGYFSIFQEYVLSVRNHYSYLSLVQNTQVENNKKQKFGVKRKLFNISQYTKNYIRISSFKNCEECPKI